MHPFPPVHRSTYPNSWTYRFGLLVLTLTWVLIVLLPSGYFALAAFRASPGLTGAGWGALIRFAAVAVSTALLILAVVRDLRRQQPFYRSVLFPAATLLLVASIVLPRLV